MKIATNRRVMVQGRAVRAGVGGNARGIIQGDGKGWRVTMQGRAQCAGACKYARGIVSILSPAALINNSMKHRRPYPVPPDQDLQGYIETLKDRILWRDIALAFIIILWILS